MIPFLEMVKFEPLCCLTSSLVYGSASPKRVGDPLPLNSSIVIFSENWLWISRYFEWIVNKKCPVIFCKLQKKCIRGFNTTLSNIQHLPSHNVLPSHKCIYKLWLQVSDKILFLDINCTLGIWEEGNDLTNAVLQWKTFAAFFPSFLTWLWAIQSPFFPKWKIHCFPKFLELYRI